MANTLTIGLLTLSAIADDPRVRRQGDAFAAAGWDVIGVGLSGAASKPPAWPIDDRTPALDWAISSRGPNFDTAGYPKRSSRWTGVARDAQYLFDLQASRVSGKAAVRAYWMQNHRYRALFSRASGYCRKIWLANDWTTLPIAARLAQEQGGILVYDTHELAADEYAERFMWRTLHRPLVMAIERQGLQQAALVLCVSKGIAGRIQEIYRLSEEPLVVLNTPAYDMMPFRPTGRRIEVLYHGVVAPGRGLEESIASVALWRSEFRLTLRGPCGEAYRRDLERRIMAAGVSDRVRLLPAVPMTNLVKEAHAADVGLFVLPGHSQHNRFALPNKFFEYIMAGLALCVSELPEMARLVRHYDLGHLIRGLSPQAIAKQVNSLDRDAIDRYKRNALTAGRQLNWTQESRKLLVRCSALVTGPS